MTPRAPLTAHQARLALLLIARRQGVEIVRNDRRCTDMPFQARYALCTAKRRLTLASGESRNRSDVDTLRHELVHALTDGGVDSWEGVDPDFCRWDRRLAYMVGGVEALQAEVARHASDCCEAYDPQSDASYERGQRWAARHRARLARIAATAAELPAARGLGHERLRSARRPRPVAGPPGAVQRRSATGV